MYRLMIKVAIISMLSSLLLWGLEICYAITSGAWMVRGMGGTAFFLLLTFLLFAGWGVVAAIIQWIYLAVAGAVGRRLAKGGSIARAQLGTSLFIAVTLAPYLGCFTWQLFAGKGISKWVWIWHLRIGFFAVSVVGVFLIAWIIVRSTQSWFLPARRCRCVCSSLLGMAFVLVLYALNARMYVGQYDVVHQAMSLVIFFATEFSLINAMGVKRLDRLPGRGVAAVFFGLLFLIPVELATLTYITGGTPGSQQLSYVYSQTHLARQLIWIYDFNRGAEGAEDVYYREYLNRRNQFVACAPALARKGCNFVLIVVDSLRADHLAMYGYGRDTAPNLEALARKSIVFTHAYAQGTDTNTSLPALMTGCYMSSVIRKGGIERMETLPEALKSCGYSTKALVHGYDIRTFGDKQREGAAFDAIDAPEEHFAEHIAQKAVKLLRGDVPFAPLFLWLMYGEPHDPYEKQDGYDFGDRALDLYDSEIAYTDKCIGQVLDCIRDTGHDEDTVVVVTADHGEEIGEYGGWGHAVKLWNAIIHVPLIVYIPRVAPAVVDSPVQLVDVFPSMLNLLDCGYSGFPDGSSFLPCITAGPLPYEALAIAEAHQGGILNKVCAIRYPWKLVYHRSDSYFTLVDLDRDPSEKVNRISERPDIGRLLTRMLLSYLSYQERGATPRGEAAGAAEKTLRRLAANDAGALRELAGIDVAQITPADFDRWASLLKRHFSREVAQFYLAVARARGDLRPAAMRELREIVGNADEIRGGR